MKTESLLKTQLSNHDRNFNAAFYNLSYDIVTNNLTKFEKIDRYSMAALILTTFMKYFD